MSVVSDASPLIALSDIGRVDLLAQLFDEVLVLPAVHREVYGGGRRALPEWIRVTMPGRPIGLALSAAGLGAGETEAIGLALELELGARLLLLDDLRDRAVAREQGVPHIGLGGLLLAARGRGLIPRVDAILDELTAGGFRLGPRLVARLLTLAGELDGG